MNLKDLYEQATKGTYAGVRFDTETKRALHKYIKENKIPNSIRADKAHTTLLYSRKHLPNYKPAGKINMTGNPTGLTVWNSQGTNGPKTKCLILKYDCPALAARHKALMKEHDATYDFPQYKTHVTLSYDIGELDVNKLPDPSEIGPLKIVEEYGEDLDLNWAQNKGVKRGG